MAETTTLKIAREIAEQARGCVSAYRDSWEFDGDELARLITEKLTPLVKKVDRAAKYIHLVAVNHDMKNRPTHYKEAMALCEDLHRELERIKGGK